MKNKYVPRQFHHINENITTQKTLYLISFTTRFRWMMITYRMGSFKSGGGRTEARRDSSLISHRWRFVRSRGWSLLRVKIHGWEPLSGWFKCIVPKTNIKFCTIYTGSQHGSGYGEQKTNKKCYTADRSQVSFPLVERWTIAYRKWRPWAHNFDWSNYLSCRAYR